MTVTFREATIWIHLIATVLAFGTYFTQVGRLFARGAADPAAISGLFIVAVIVLAVIEALTHTLLYLAARRSDAPPADERDRTIALHASRNGYLVLIIGVWIVLGTWWLPWSDPLLAVNLLLLAFVLAEAVRFGSQLVGYRRTG
jgi:uncharacterized membrane protein